MFLLGGFGLLGIVAILALILHSWGVIIYIGGCIGLIGLVLSALFSGILVSGDRIRGNYATEPEKDHSLRKRWSLNLFLLGFPSFIVALITLSLSK